MYNSIITPLWHINSLVDNARDTKKKIIDAFVTDKKIASSLNEFNEAQCNFTKIFNRTVDALIKQSVEKVTESVKSK